MAESFSRSVIVSLTDSEKIIVSIPVTKGLIFSEKLVSQSFLLLTHFP